MTDKGIHKLLVYCTAAIWFVNGLFCKVLNLVPRHQQIVARILGDKYSRTLTIVIGFSEIAMAIWIVSSIKTRLNAISQVIVITAMNTIEFFIAPDLLLWGKYNSVFACLLIIAVYYNEFYLNKKLGSQT
ncbi:MAG: DoxX-like family protein [Bacteroidota bacterium]